MTVRDEEEAFALIIVPLALLLDVHTHTVLQSTQYARLSAGPVSVVRWAAVHPDKLSLVHFIGQTDPHHPVVAEVVPQGVVEEILRRCIPNDDKMAEV